LPAPKLPPKMTVNLGTWRVGDACTILAPSRAMPPASYFAADHEAGDVLQEQQRDLALAAELDEVGALLALSRKRTPLLARMPTG
jgi:hypothetical protein